MAKKVNEIIKKLSPARRKKIEVRAATMTTEEMKARLARRSRVELGASPAEMVRAERDSR